MEKGDVGLAYLLEEGLAGAESQIFSKNLVSISQAAGSLTLFAEPSREEITSVVARRASWLSSTRREKPRFPVQGSCWDCAVHWEDCPGAC
jgi:hypothetical protein